jgi:dTDP-4-amino-4,6-dideoxygalactose transaminase
MAKLALYGGTAVRTKPYPSWPQGGAEEDHWLDKVLKSNRWFAGLQGDDPEALGSLFGKRFAALHGARYALPVSNGSVAIEVGLRALGIRPGDEVIVPPYTFISTVTSVLMVGAVPVFADIDPQSYCLDPNDVQRCIGPNTRVILPVHLAGHLADMPKLLEIAAQRNLAILEDCAQAIDAALDNKKAGTWGDLGTFSFQSNKTMTCGEGGLVLTDDPQLAEKVVALRAFGRYREKQAVRSSDLTCQQISSNYRLSEFQSAVLLGQLEKFPTEDARRQANAKSLTKGVDQIPGLNHVLADGLSMKHGYYYYLLRYDPDIYANLKPEQLCEALNAEGIPFVPGDRKPLYAHPVFEIQNLSASLCPQVLECYRQAVDQIEPGCPATEEACSRTLILRHQVLLGDATDMDDIIEALWKIYNNIDELRQRR